MGAFTSRYRLSASSSVAQADDPAYIYFANKTRQFSAMSFTTISLFEEDCLTRSYARRPRECPTVVASRQPARSPPVRPLHDDGPLKSTSASPQRGGGPFKPRWEVASEPMAHLWDQYSPYLYALHTLQQSGADANGSKCISHIWQWGVCGAGVICSFLVSELGVK